MNILLNSLLAKKEIEKLYRQKTDRLPIRYELMKIETSYGDTNVFITGALKNPPLVLLHGFFRCSELVLSEITDLAKHFLIYAVDVPVQLEENGDLQLDMQDDSFGKWMYEILSRLGAKNIFLLGFSFGGYIVLKTLAFDEKRIARAFLIHPLGVVSGRLLMRSLWKIFYSEKQDRNQRPICSWKQLQQRKEAGKETSSLSKMDLLSVPLIPKEKAHQIKTPLHVVAEKKDLLFSGNKIIKRAREIFPSLNEAVFINSSKHNSALITAMILENVTVK